jgi:predicted MFS family arabinose efflux permease
MISPGPGEGRPKVRPVERPDPPTYSWRTLAHRDIRWYFIGNASSNVGTWIQNTAQILLAYQLTRSATGVGLVIGAQFISPLFLSPFAGLLADRFDHRRILLATQLVSTVVAATMAVLQSAGRLPLPGLVAGAFLIGVAFTFTLPAQAALIPSLVPADETRAALALNGVSSNVGRALAPILGAGLVVTVGFGWAFALNAASFLLLAGVLITLRPRRAPRVRRASLLDGLRLVRSNRRLQVILLVVAASTVATDPPLVLGPSLAHGLGIGATASSYFLAAFGTGTVFGSLAPQRRCSLSGTARYLSLLGAAIACFALTGTAWIAIVAVAVAGAASLLIGAATQTLLLRAAGPARAGRVMAIWAVAFAGSRPIATAADSWLSGVVGAGSSSVLLALPAILIGGLIVSLKMACRGNRWGNRILGGRIARHAVI